MPSSEFTVYLITGANRGIGLGLVRKLLEDKDAVVFAGARDPSSANELKDLASASPDRLYLVKLNSGSVEDAKAVAAEIEAKAGKLDVLIANAGESIGIDLKLS